MASEIEKDNKVNAMEQELKIFLDVLLAIELLEVDCVPAIQQLVSLLKLQSISIDSKLILYGLEDPDKGECSQWIVIQAIKGSFFTHCWNTSMRFDDEYLILLFDDEEDAQSYMKSMKIDNLTENIVVHMKGFDAINKRLLSGFLDWHHIRHLKKNLKINQIGPVAFAKILTRMLFLLPIFVKHKQYLIPMPVTLM